MAVNVGFFLMGKSADSPNFLPEEGVKGIAVMLSLEDCRLRLVMLDFWSSSPLPDDLEEPGPSVLLFLN